MSQKSVTGRLESHVVPGRGYREYSVRDTSGNSHAMHGDWIRNGGHYEGQHVQVNFSGTYVNQVLPKK